MLKKILKITAVACLTANAYAVEKAMEFDIEQTTQLGTGCIGASQGISKIVSIKFKRNTKEHDYVRLKELRIINRNHIGQGPIIYDYLLKVIKEEEAREMLKEHCLPEIADPVDKTITTEQEKERLYKELLPALNGFHLVSTREVDIFNGTSNNPLRYLLKDKEPYEKRPGHRFGGQISNKIIFRNPNYLELPNNDNNLKNQIKKLSFSFEYSSKKEVTLESLGTDDGTQNDFSKIVFKTLKELEKFVQEDPEKNTKIAFNTLIYFSKNKEVESPYDSYKEELDIIDEQDESGIFHVKNKANMINEEHTAYKHLNNLFSNKYLDLTIEKD